MHEAMLHNPQTIEDEFLVTSSYDQCFRVLRAMLGELDSDFEVTSEDEDGHIEYVVEKITSSESAIVRMMTMSEIALQLVHWIATGEGISELAVIDQMASSRQRYLIKKHDQKGDDAASTN